MIIEELWFPQQYLIPFGSEMNVVMYVTILKIFNVNAVELKHLNSLAHVIKG